MTYSCLMSNGSYEDHHLDKSCESAPYLGREDTATGQHKICCVPSEELDEVFELHTDYTDDDERIDYRGVEDDLGLDEGSLKDGCMRPCLCRRGW